jgi:hypothetical protein
MRLKFTFAVATAVVLAGCGDKPKTTAGEPTLQETQVWMHDFVAARGFGGPTFPTFEGSDCSTCGEQLLLPLIT